MSAESATSDVQVEASEQAQILIRALKWYADPKNWNEDDWGVKAVVNPPDYGDPGKKARNALKKVGVKP